MSINGMGSEAAREVMAKEPSTLKNKKLVFGSIIGLVTLAIMITYSLKWGQASRLDNAYQQDCSKRGDCREGNYYNIAYFDGPFSDETQAASLKKELG